VSTGPRNQRAFDQAQPKAAAVYQALREYKATCKPSKPWPPTPQLLWPLIPPALQCGQSQTYLYISRALVRLDQEAETGNPPLYFRSA
jgi:hypothetical protein